VPAPGVIPDAPPAGFAGQTMTRLRQLAEETIAAVERRIDEGGDAEAVQQQMAGTIYEIRRRMEVIEQWFTHRESA